VNNNKVSWERGVLLFTLPEALQVATVFDCHASLIVEVFVTHTNLVLVAITYDVHQGHKVEHPLTNACLALWNQQVHHLHRPFTMSDKGNGNF
jgi:hypothetical protein